MGVVLPPDKATQLQYSGDLDTWFNYGSAVMSIPGGMYYRTLPNEDGIDPPVATGQGQLFYRAISRPIAAQFSETADLVCLEVTESQTLFDVLALARIQWGVDLFVPPVVDQSQVIPVGTYCGPSAGYILEALGIPTWEQLPDGEDATFTNKFPGLEPKQVDPVPEAPRSDKRMDDGYEGDPEKPDPLEGESPDTPSDQNDKGFVEIVDQAQPGDVQFPGVTEEPGAHYRLAFNLDIDGGLVAEDACKSVGDALLPPSVGAPGMDSLVVVVSSPSAAPSAPAHVFHLEVIDSPWNKRAYGAFEEPHLEDRNQIARLRAAIPLPAGITTMPADLNVQFYRVFGETDMTSLTPESFTNNISVMTLLGELSGLEILLLCEESPAPLMKSSARPGSSILPLGVSRDPDITSLHLSGSRAKKFNIVIVGDGFQDTAADQAVFNSFVKTNIMESFFATDVNAEVMNALNVFRINTYSVESGVTRITTDASNNVVVTRARNTALEMRYSGMWGRCWMEGTPTYTFPLPGGTETSLQQQVYSRVPEVDFVIVVLNETNMGGCAMGGRLFAATLGSRPTTLSHEFGHMFGGLQDEYLCTTSVCTTIYNFGPLNEANHSNWDQLRARKWSEWVPSWRPVPTVLADINNTVEDVGYFHGGTRGSQRFLLGLFRPSWDNRMNSNWPQHSPVGYAAMREKARQRQQTDLRNHITGDFNGDGSSDIILHDETQLTLYTLGSRPFRESDPILGRAPRPDSPALNRSWTLNGRVGRVAAPGGFLGSTILWEIKPGDIYLPADFDGDGLTDLIAINMDSWQRPYVGLLRTVPASFGLPQTLLPVARFDGVLPGWGEIRSADQFFTGDFDGDDKTDLYVYNGKDWDIPYLLMLRSTGTDLVFHRRYDRFLSTWEMGRQERFLTGNFDGDNLTDLVALNTRDWSQGHLHMYRSTGTHLNLLARHYGTFNGWALRNNDQVVVLPSALPDIHDQLAFFNGSDWDSEYLLFATLGAGELVSLNRYRDSADTWDLKRGDRFIAADVDGSRGPADLVVLNTTDWGASHLGILNNNPANGVATSRGQVDWIGGWKLSHGDQIEKADFSTPLFVFLGPWNDLFISNKDYFGMLRSVGSRYVLDAIYPKWINNHRYHEYGWW